ncbi:MAG: hypothetical protein RL839_07375 [Gammaproteobacteria bacterium]
MTKNKIFLLVAIAFSVGAGSGFKFADAQSNDSETLIWELEHDYFARLGTPGGGSAFWHEEFLGWPQQLSTPMNVEGPEPRPSPVASRGTEASGYELEEMGIRVHGDAAVAHYRVNFDSPEQDDLRVFHFWVSTDEGWKILGGASSIESL